MIVAGFLWTNGIQPLNWATAAAWCLIIPVSAGVGCVAAIIKGALTGAEPNCDCGPESCC